MNLTRRLFCVLTAGLVLQASPVFAGQAGDGVKRLAIQISDNDPATFNKALNVATNFARGMSEKGELYEIEIVTFNAGLHMLRQDTSPVLDRVKSISESVPDVTFSACGNTFKGMTKKEGKEPPLTEHASMVPAGVVRLMELDDEGYYVIRP